MRRFPFIAVLLALAALAATQSVAEAGLVPSFGHGGVALLDPPRPPHVEVGEDTSSQAAPDGSTYLIASVRGCYTKDCFQYLFRFRRDGKPDLDFGGRGFVPLDEPGGGIYSLGVDSRSRPVLARSLSYRKKEGTQVLRFTTRGRLDRAFEGDGRAFLPKLRGYRATIEPAPGAGLLISREEEGRRGATIVGLDELHGNGTPVKSFGRDGFVAVPAPADFPLAPVAAPRGAILIVAGACCGGAVSVVRVSARGRLDRRFDRTAKKSLAPLAELGGGAYESMPRAADAAARPDGGVEIFGGTGMHGFEARLTAAGRPARTFGRRGIHLYEQPLDAALPLRGGGVLGLSQGLFGPLRPFLFGPDGTWDPRLRAVPLAPYTSLIDMVPIGPGTVDVTFGRRYEKPESEPPFVARLRLPPGEAFR